MNKPDKAGEPSMDEILSSIRKIISEEPIGSQSRVEPGTSGPAANATDTLGRIRFGGGTEILGVVAEDTTHSGAQPTTSLPQTPADLNADNQHQETTSGMRTFEPQLPMPGTRDLSGNQQEDNPLDRPSLSSRLANALRGDVPSSPPMATQATFDDDDLSAVLDDVPDPVALDETTQSTSLNIASFKERLASLTMNEEDSVTDLASSTADTTEFPSESFSETNPESVADPFSALRNVSVVASTEPNVKVDPISEAPAPVSLDKTVEDDPKPEFVSGLEKGERSFSEDRNGVHAPLFDSGPQPPSSLRPRAFSTNEKSESSALDVNGQADTSPASTTVSQPETSAIEESVEGRGEEIKTVPVDPINTPAHPGTDAASTALTSSKGGEEELVGLAAAVAAKQQGPDKIAASVAEASVEVVKEKAEALVKEDAGEELIVSEEANATSTEQGQASDNMPEVSQSATVAAVSEQPSISAAATPAAAPSAAEFTAATVTASISPTGVQTLEDTVADLLRPLLREWLTENMPRIVEKALRIEMASSLTTDANSSDGVQIDGHVSRGS